MNKVDLMELKNTDQLFIEGIKIGQDMSVYFALTGNELRFLITYPKVHWR